MAIVSREDWGARSPRSVVRVSWSSRKEFVVHHSAGPKSQSVRSIQDFHMDSNGWSDIGYNFLVDEHGKVYEGRGWLVVGAHAPGHNTSGIGVCYIGNNNPTDKALKAVRGLYQEANRRAGRKLKVLGHREVYPTSCPGSKLQGWIDSGMADEEEDDLSKLPTLTIGDSSFDVKTVRWLLGARGYEPADLWSFDFDQELGRTVNEFKKAHGLAQDMVWGDKCWTLALRIA
jgi:hypothetical protein